MRIFSISWNYENKLSSSTTSSIHKIRSFHTIEENHQRHKCKTNLVTTNASKLFERRTTLCHQHYTPRCHQLWVHLPRIWGVPIEAVWMQESDPAAKNATTASQSASKFQIHQFCFLCALGIMSTSTRRHPALVDGSMHTNRWDTLAGLCWCGYSY
jgi:hypothetical protein